MAYIAGLKNHSGATFDIGEFDDIKAVKKWAKGRGKTIDFGVEYDYTVTIKDGNGEIIDEYQTH